MTRKILSVLLLLACNYVFAQKDFEGKIVMTIKVSAEDPSMKSMESMMPTSSTVYVKGPKSRVETTAPMVGNMVMLMDTSKKEMTTLMDMMGQKIAMKTSFGDIEKKQDGHGEEMKKTMRFKETNDTKMIIGYLCKKVIMTMEDNGKEIISEIWYSPEIPNSSNQMPELKGMPLEYAMETQGFKMSYTVASIDKEKVADSMFEIPQGYTVKTMEELMQGFGGAAQPVTPTEEVAPKQK